MRLSNFKKELLRSLFTENEDQIHATLIADKILFCAIDNECRKYYCIDCVLKYESVSDLYGCYHLEADTCVMFHAKHADLHHPGNIIVRANDADVCIILTTNVHHLANSHLRYDAGLEFDNTREYVDVTSLSTSIHYTRSLAGCYAFFGNDYLPAFLGKERSGLLKL